MACKWAGIHSPTFPSFFFLSFFPPSLGAAWQVAAALSLQNKPVNYSRERGTNETRQRERNRWKGDPWTRRGQRILSALRSSRRHLRIPVRFGLSRTCLANLTFARDRKLPSPQTVLIVQAGTASRKYCFNASKQENISYTLDLYVVAFFFFWHGTSWNRRN